MNLIQYYKKINTITSDRTKQMRQQIKSLQDKFMTFSWGGYDAFENFGAFIINDKKGSLKFYNGPSFTNEYSKPQFSASAGDLQGVSFNRQTIAFTIGLYWFNIQQYRLFLNWLDPLKISYLIFGFNPDFRYNVKLSKLGDSTKWIVGNENGEPMYYTEIPLTFEVQGTPCAIGVVPYEFQEWTLFNGQTYKTALKDYSYIQSDLETPVEIEIPLSLRNLSDNHQDGDKYQVSLVAKLYHTTKTIDENGDENIQKEWLSDYSLFNLSLKNLPMEIVSRSSLVLNLKYNSETGLMFLTYGDDTEHLLNLTYMTATGKHIVDSYTVNKFMLPGKFNYPDFNLTDVEFHLSVINTRTSVLVTEMLDQVENQVPIIQSYSRTNIL